ncbi:MAG: LexA family transcriptional regulator [Gammaproteobacteria bacterium]|nr:LexA family transcriptional regulator [Gammaproteobacteria bacterium]
MNTSVNLKHLIETHNLNTLELSRRTGIGQPVIYRIISGETDNPKIATVCALADYFGISVNQLIGETPLPNSKNEIAKLFEIPLYDQDHISNWPNLSSKIKENIEKVPSDLTPSPNLYALRSSDESMEPLFPKDTILILDGDKKPQNHSYIVVKLKSGKDILFRQLIVDDDLQYLKPLNPDSDKYKMKLFNPKADKCLGTLIQAKMDY